MKLAAPKKALDARWTFWINRIEDDRRSRLTLKPEKWLQLVPFHRYWAKTWCGRSWDAYYEQNISPILHKLCTDLWRCVNILCNKLFVSPAQLRRFISELFFQSPLHLIVGPARCGGWQGFAEPGDRAAAGAPPQISLHWPDTIWRWGTKHTCAHTESKLCNCTYPLMFSMCTLTDTNTCDKNESIRKHCRPPVSSWMKRLMCFYCTWLPAAMAELMHNMHHVRAAHKCGKVWSKTTRDEFLCFMSFHFSCLER